MLRRASTAAFSLLENVVACGVIAIGLAGTYIINGQCMDILRMAKDQAAASQILQQRIEHLRIGNWQRISSTAWIKTSILNATADGSASLQGLVETVKVTPYNSTTANATHTNTFERNGTTIRAGGSTTGIGTNKSLIDENSLVILWTVTWKGLPLGKEYTREVVTVLGKGGIAK